MRVHVKVQKVEHYVALSLHPYDPGQPDVILIPYWITGGQDITAAVFTHCLRASVEQGTAGTV